MSRSLDILSKEYLDWMCNLACGDEYSKRLSYRKLLSYLHEKDFIYIIDLDGNRAEDGENLRSRFADEYEHKFHCDGRLIQEYLDDRPCSVLEMMVALANRCEESIMDNLDLGNRTGQWFWGMIDSLGLESMNDLNFDEREADDIIDRFLNREYDEDGKGSLFTIKNCKYDLRTVEIWAQMCWYLEDYI